MINRRSQGAMEYLVIIAAVLIISATVVFLVTGAAGQQKQSVIINSCRQAASQCKLQLTADSNAECSFCEEQCTYGNGTEIFEGAVKCCQLGQEDMIYDGSPGCAECGDGVLEGDEECDGSEFGNASCSDYGYTGGSLSCNSDCKIDTSGCTGCTDDSMCSGNQVCCSGLCQDPQCTSDSDCSDDTTCKDYYCSNPGECTGSCQWNAQGEGQTCQSQSVSCSGCTKETTTYACSSGNCDPSTTSTDCSPYQCSGESCLTSCTDDLDCCGSHFCDAGECIAPQCSSDTDCAAGEKCCGSMCASCPSSCEGFCTTTSCDGSGNCVCTSTNSRCTDVGSNIGKWAMVGADRMIKSSDTATDIYMNERWDTGVPTYSRPLATNDFVIQGYDAYDEGTGSEVGEVSVMPDLVEDYYIYGRDNGDLVKMNSDLGTEVWRTPISGVSLSHVIKDVEHDGNYLYISADDTVYKIMASDGSIVGTHTLEAGKGDALTPTLCRDRLYVGRTGNDAGFVVLDTSPFGKIYDTDEVDNPVRALHPITCYEGLKSLGDYVFLDAGSIIQQYKVDGTNTANKVDEWFVATATGLTNSNLPVEGDDQPRIAVSNDYICVTLSDNTLKCTKFGAGGNMLDGDVCSTNLNGGASDKRITAPLIASGNDVIVEWGWLDGSSVWNWKLGKFNPSTCNLQNSVSHTYMVVGSSPIIANNAIYTVVGVTGGAGTFLYKFGQAYCGDAICDGGETTSTCCEDCGTSCGDGACNCGETEASCSDDCGGNGGTTCGDGVCEGDEDSTNCCLDCACSGGKTCQECEGVYMCVYDCPSFD